MRENTWRMILVLCALSLIAVACGPDDDEGATPVSVDATSVSEDPTAVPATATPVGEDPTAVPATATLVAEDPTAVPASATAASATAAPVREISDEIPSGDADSEWCRLAREVDAELDNIEVIGTFDPVALEDAYVMALASIKRAREEAPPELEQALEETIDGFEVLTGALGDADYNLLDLDLSGLGPVLSGLDVAGYEIDRYNFYVCQMDNGFDAEFDPAGLGVFDDPTATDVTDGTIREQVTVELTAAGFTQAEAECVIDEVDLAELQSGDFQVILAAMAKCGISVDRLGELNF